MTDYQGGVRVAAFATGGLIPLAMRGTKVLGAMHICDVHVAFCALGGVSDCRDPVAGLPDIDGVERSKTGIECVEYERINVRSVRVDYRRARVEAEVLRDHGGRC